MDVLLALAMTFCFNYNYPDKAKIDHCYKEFNICRERQIWGFLDHPHDDYDFKWEQRAFLICHEEFLQGNTEWK